LTTVQTQLCKNLGDVVNATRLLQIQQKKVGLKIDELISKLLVLKRATNRIVKGLSSEAFFLSGQNPLFPDPM
jgi:hypothetical protein